ncbi:uncharacterized protein H6S33_012062 [Morchella sextelata]|uniref:uncharacterized protein n=1 Tax=Morchella sextelata TaxID=1174677 RepID=UPI001D04B436|nr:uncharacterized protein H6S33_012062 [Morchella sextelata]KAH0610535.1 hypothetical protein H6S33_012062 [Morchella sextelata]
MTPPPQPKPPSPKEFWGYLISREQPTQPTPLFRNLLIAIANYIIEKLEPLEVRCLTPEKISSFYHNVGGDLDDLFLSTPPDALSSIYTTLGCSHTLQPSPRDDFVPPSIPALTSRGFVTWQTIQLLLDPVEHVPYLQEAVRVFPLQNPESGEFFPREIPSEAFPSAPDQETVRWHDEMFEKKKERDALKEATAAAAAATAPASKHGKVQVPVGGEHVEQPPAQEYHRHHHHYAPQPQQYQEHYVSSRSRKSRRAPAPAPEPPIEAERYSRSAPGVSDANNPFTHHSRHHGNHVSSETVFASDGEGGHPHSRHQSRHHSRRGTREREFVKPYHYENGVVTPIAPIFTTEPVYVDGIRILNDQIPSSPPLGGAQHFHYHAPTVTAEHPGSCSSSNSDLHGAYHNHYRSHHQSPEHLSHGHHRDRSRPSRSSSPLHGEPVLRKSVSAYYPGQEPTIHAHSHSRSRSGSSGRRIRREVVSDMDSDVSDVYINGANSGWTLHNERARLDEEERLRSKEQEKLEKHRRRQAAAARELAERERGATWGAYEATAAPISGGGAGARSGRSSGGRRYYRVEVEEAGRGTRYS